MVDASSGQSTRRDAGPQRRAEAPTHASIATIRVVEIADDGSWLHASPHPVRSLVRRRHLRRIVAALSRAHDVDPSASLSALELFDAGWPDQRCSVCAARNSVHVAIATLRTLGLAGVIVFDGRGYRFAAGIELRRIQTNHVRSEP